ncbi:MAG: formate dehydrogenase subunit delta [Mycobacterium sp.]
MPIETLIRMGQQIARNNAALPVPRAADRIARHLKSFWTPGMIAELEVYAAANPEELDATLLAAIGQLEREPGA